MGYISHYFDADNLDQLKNYLTPYPGNDYIRNMVSNYAIKISGADDGVLIIRCI